ncbi:hypothetical protein BROUX41_001928 [Berkeleyomyces rouxiae]
MIPELIRRAAILRDLNEGPEKIEYIRLYWLDFSSIPRARVFPVGQALESMRNLREFYVGVASAWTGLMPDDSYIGSSAAGEQLLLPEWDSLRLGPRAGHASVQGAFYMDQNRNPSTQCPRSQLEQVIREAEELGLKFRIGFEMEFMILERDPSGNLVSKYQGSWSYARALDTGYAARVIEPTIKKLKACGINVEQYHAEAASSQYEIILPHKPPMEAIENLLHAREILYATAMEENLVVTFHPKFDTAKCGSGSHVHISLEGRLDTDAKAYESFYAGILHELPALLAFTYSSPASYLRMKDKFWAGGSKVAWGKQDKEAALRVIHNSHWELKTMDGMANPYLALAAILTAGRLGYTKKMKLNMAECSTPELFKGPTTNGINGDCAKSQRAFPESLPDALALLKKSEVTRCLTADLLACYMDVKKAEVAMYERMSEDEMRTFICNRY